MTRQETRRIELRRFGRTDLQVSEYGLGCARIGGIFKHGPGEFLDILSSAFDGGITFFDTSNIYSQGESEALLGRAFRRRRDRVVIASKAGYVLPARRQLVARLKPLVRPLLKAVRLRRHHLPSAVRGSLAQDFSPVQLRQALEGSLRRLRTEWLDLLQLHAPPSDVVAAGDWIETLEALKREGKIRYYGVSCESLDASMAALQHAGLASVQLPLNVVERRELSAVAAARDRGVAVIARECLGNGLLVKDIASVEEARRFCQTDEEAARKFTQIQEYRRLGREAGVSMPEIALRWVNALDGVSVSLIGVSRREQLDQLLAGGLPSADVPLVP